MPIIATCFSGVVSAALLLMLNGPFAAKVFYAFATAYFFFVAGIYLGKE